MKKLTNEFVTSLITIILAILAIGIFIYSGGSILFYAVIAIAIIFGFYNVWLVSKAVSKTAAPPVARRLKGRKR